MLVVKKFGGTSVANKERIFNVAKRCIEDYQKGNDVVVVLSAMGKQTDVLLDMANDINPKASKRELDMLLTTGEQTSVALMAMAMQSLNVPAISLNAFQVAMHTTSVAGNARLKKIDTERIQHELEQRKIVIVTGFQGISQYDDYTTLGVEVPTQQPLLWLLHFVQMPVRFTQTLTAYIRQIQELLKMLRNWMRSLMMKCLNWQVSVRAYCTTALWKWRRNMEYSLLYVLV